MKRTPALQKQIDAIGRKIAYLADLDPARLPDLETIITYRIEASHQNEQAAIKRAAKGDRP
jgi:hypothetical protein